MAKKDTYPTQEEIDDFVAWVYDLPQTQQAIIQDLPDILDVLPRFANEWKLGHLWSIIRDNL